MKAMIDIKSTGFKRYFANTSWLIGHRVLSMVVSLFVGVYVARYLGPDRFGILSYASSFVWLFTALANLGLDGIMVRELVKTPEHRDELLGTAFCLKTGGAVFMWISIAAAVPFANNDAQTNFLISIIALAVMFQALNVIDFNYQAEVKSKIVVYVSLAQLAVSSITKLVLIWISAPLVWFAVVFLFDALVKSVGLAVMYLKNTGKLWYWKWRWKIAKVLLKDSWPLILSGMIISIYMKIDQVMIKEMIGTVEVGQYAAAARLSEAWYFIPMAITSSVFPAIIKAKKESESLYYSRLQGLYYLIVWLAVAIALPTTFLAPWLIKILYGEAFLPAGRVLTIHIWGGVFVSLAVIRGKFFLVENLQKLSLYTVSIGCFLNIFLNIILIGCIGIVGAALSTLLARLLSFYFISICFKSVKISMTQFHKSLMVPYVYLIKIVNHTPWN